MNISFLKTRNSFIGILLLILISSIFLNSSLQFSVGEKPLECNNTTILIQADVTWFDSNWTECLKIDILNPGSTLTNYTVKVNLAPKNFNYSKAHVDGNDLRFTYLDNVTILNYWIEEWNNTASSTIWVNIPLLETSSTRIILLYYGYNDAISFSNGSLTFDAFDDFSGSELNEEIWDVTAYEDGIQSYDLINGELNVNISVSGYGNDSGYFFCLKQNLTQENYVITCKSRWENLDHYRGFGIFNGIYLLDYTNHSYFQTVALWGDDHVGIYRNVETTAEHINVADLTEGNAYTEYKALGTSYNFSLSGSYNYDYIFSNSNFDDPFRVYLVTRIGGRDESPVSGDVYYDFFHIRKSVADEPEVTIDSLIIVDTIEPIIELVSPSEFGTYPEGTSVTLRITDNSNSEIDFSFNWDNDQNITDVLPSSGYIGFGIPTEPGQHILYVYASDNFGNEAFESFTLYTEAPTTITSPFSSYISFQISLSYIPIFVASLGTLFLAYRIFRKRK